MVNEYVISYMDRERAALEKAYPTFEAFDKGFEAGDAMLEGLTGLGGQRGVEFDEQGFAASAPLMLHTAQGARGAAAFRYGGILPGDEPGAERGLPPRRGDTRRLGAQGGIPAGAGRLGGDFLDCTFILLIFVQPKITQTYCPMTPHQPSRREPKI